MNNGSVMSILRVLTKPGGDDEKPEAYALRYAENFFSGSNEVASSLRIFSKGGSKTIEMRTSKSFSPPR